MKYMESYIQEKLKVFTTRDFKEGPIEEKFDNIGTYVTENEGRIPSNESLEIPIRNQKSRTSTRISYAW